MKAMIFAAGLGTRLKPLTDHMPKALVPVCQRPLLEWLLHKLRLSGYTDITINVHHFAEQIEAYVTSHPLPGVRIHISDERKALLETGGGLHKAAPILLSDTEDGPILIHNVDILSNADLREFYRANRMYDAALLVSQRKTSRYLLFDESNRLVGWTNISTGEVRSPYPNLDVSACRMYAFSGIHLFSPRLFPRMENWPERFSIIDFYLSICHQVHIQGVFRPDLRLLDVGKQDSLTQAGLFLQQLLQK